MSNGALCGKRRPGSACVHAQADLGLHCPHMPEYTFRMARPEIPDNNKCCIFFVGLKDTVLSGSALSFTLQPVF